MAYLRLLKNEDWSYCMNSHYERALSIEQSLDIANQMILDSGLRTSDKAHGADFQTYCCKLMDDDHKSIFYGFGKGLGLQSKASAYYEALEHYAIHRFAQKIASEKANYINMDSYEHPLPCVELTEIHDQEKMTYPIFMLDPRYVKQKADHDIMDYTAYAWQACDNGTASGTNMTEASIHALNELIERDAHSLFLIEAFLKNKNHKLKLIDKNTLSLNLLVMTMKIEEQYKDNLMIFDISSEIGIPVIYVSMTKQPFLIQPSGCGASLNAEYAVERALLETLQPVHFQNQQLFDNQRTIIDQLSKFPLLQKAAIADVTALRDKCEYIEFDQFSDFDKTSTLTQQFETIVRKIKSKDFSIFQIPIIHHDSGFACIKYVIPDFEQFHLVQTGKKILPNKRGLGLLN